MTDLSKADERACEPLIDVMASLLDQQTVTISMGALLEIQRSISKRDVALRQALEALDRTETYLRIEVHLAYARDAHINTINSLEQKLKHHKETSEAIKKVLNETS